MAIRGQRAGLILIVTVAIEWVRASNGLGFAVRQSFQGGRLPVMWVGLVHQRLIQAVLAFEVDDAARATWALADYTLGPLSQQMIPPSNPTFTDT